METGGSESDVGGSFAFPLEDLAPEPVALDIAEPMIELELLLSRLDLSDGLPRPTTAIQVSSDIDVLVTGGYRNTS
jgi:hypothetical protein